MLEHHSLTNEFPEHHDALHSLKISDTHYHKMMDRYDEVDKKIFRIESTEEIASDIELGKLKKERIQLKDCIISRVKQMEAVTI